MTDVAPPATDEWWDTVLTKAAVLHQLRLREGDVDEDRVEALIPVAGQLINVYLDRPAVSPGWPVPVQLQPAIEKETIRLYDSRLSTQDVVNYGAVDPLSETAATLAGLKRRWGVA